MRDDDSRNSRKLKQEDKYEDLHHLPRHKIVNLYRQKRQALLTVSPEISSDEFDDLVRGVRAVAFWTVGQVFTWLDEKIALGEGVGK